MNAFTTTTLNFNQPAVGANVNVEVANSTWAAVGQFLFIETGGTYEVIAVPDATHVTVQNLYATNAAPGAVINAGSKVSPAGEEGAAGAPGAPGAAGVNAFTTTTLNFNQPAVGANVNVEVANSTWAAVGQFLFIETGGTYEVIAVPDATHVTVQNLYATNAAPGAVINAGSKVSPAGEEGAAGAPGAPGAAGVNAFTNTTANFVQPAVGAAVLVDVLNSTWMAVGQLLYIETGGSYEVTGIPDATHVTVENLGYSGNAAPAAVIVAPQPVVAGAYASPPLDTQITHVDAGGEAALWSGGLPASAGAAISRFASMLQAAFGITIPAYATVPAPTAYVERIVRMQVGTAAVQDSADVIPGTAILKWGELKITTSYSGGGSVSGGNAATPALVWAAGDVSPQAGANTVFRFDHDTSWGGVDGPFRITVGGAPAAGAGVATIAYAIPSVTALSTAPAGVYRKLRGFVGTLWQLGIGGPHIKVTGGNVEHRNAADSAFVKSRSLAADGTSANDNLVFGAPGAYAPVIVSNGTEGSAAGQATAQAVYQEWRHLDTPAGVGLVAHWKLNGVLTDSGPNALTLTVDTGTARYLNLMPGLSGFVFDGATILTHAVATALLQLTGPMTFECVLMFDQPPGATGWLVYTERGDTAIGGANERIMAQVFLGTSTTFCPPQWNQQSNAGATSSYAPTNVGLPIGRPFHFAMTRSADAAGSQTINMYVDGLVNTSGTVTTNASAGLNQRLSLGGNWVGNNFFYTGAMSNVRIWDVERSAAQILASSRYLRGCPVP